MANDHRLLDPEPDKCLVKEVSLGGQGPDSVPRPHAVAVARAVEGDDPVALGGAVQDTAGAPILDQGHETMQQDQGLALAALDIVQVDAINIEEAAEWRVLSFCPARLGLRPEG